MKKWIIGGAAAAIVLLGGVFAFWYTQIRVETDPEAELSETAVVDSPDASADGSYTIPSGTDSFVGYRAQEVVLGRSQTPTGRTDQVTGTFVISRATISEVTMTANLTGLSTGESRRDGRAQSALDTAQFPDATFELTEPIEMVSPPVAGKTITANAVGELTIKGTTLTVAIPIEGRWDGDQIEIVTATPFPIRFSEFGVDIGDFRPFAEVEDEGGLEFDLFFTKT